MKNRFPILAAAFLSCFVLVHPAAICQTLADEVVSKPARTDKLGDPLPEGALLRIGTKRFQHPTTVSQLSLTGDDNIVVSMDSLLLIGWDANDGKELWRQTRVTDQNAYFSAAGYGIQPISVHPKMGQFVTDDGPGKIAFWDPATGERDILELAFPATAKSMHVSPDGKSFAIGGAEQLVVCDETGKQLFTKPNHPQERIYVPGEEYDGDRMKFGGEFSYAKFSPDGALLALVNSEKPKTIQLLKAKTGDSVRDIVCSGRVVRMDFSPDSKQIAATERDNSARLYDVTSANRIWEFTIPPISNAESYTSAIAFRPDGKQIAVGAPIGPDNTIRLIDVKTGKETSRLTGIGWKPWTLLYTQDSQTLFGSGWDSAIRRWDVTAGKQLPMPGGLRATSVSATSPAGRRLAFVDDGGSIHLTDLTAEETVHRIHVPGLNWSNIQFSNDGTLLAGGGVSSDDVHVVIWNSETATELHHWQWPRGKDPHSSVNALNFSASGNRIAAAVARQQSAYVWDLASDRQITKVKHKSVYGADLDAEGKVLISGGWDKHIRVWDCETGAETDSLEVKAGEREQPGRDDTRMYGLRLSPDQSLIAVVDMTASLRFFDRKLNRVSVISGVGSCSAGALEFSHNGLWAATGSRSGAARVFDIAAAAEIKNIYEHDDVDKVHFGFDDSTLLTGGADGVCYLWDLRPGSSAAGDVESLLRELTGDDATASFNAFWKLAAMPEITTERLDEKFAAAEQDVPAAEVRRWIVALGARDEEFVREAKRRLQGWGLSIHGQLSGEVAAGRMSAEKKSAADEVLTSISVNARRMAALLIQLKTPKADELIDSLLKSTRSALLKDLLIHARARRALAE